MGADRIADALPPLLRAVQRTGHPVVWICDPMHGNTFQHESGYKTRDFDDVMRELHGFFAACDGADVWPGGVHIELTGEDVTECLGGSHEVLGDDLEQRYETSATHASTPGSRSTSRSRSPSSCVAESHRRSVRTRATHGGVTRFEDLGSNSGLVEELYQRYLENPASVDEHWRAYFAGAGTAAERRRRPPPAPAARAAAAGTAGTAPRRRARARWCSTATSPSRCAAPRRARSRTWRPASASPPRPRCARSPPSCSRSTARSSTTSSRAHRRGQGQLHPPHRLRGARARSPTSPALNSSYATEDDKPVVVRHQHVNLGLAVDVQRRDGTHTLLVPSVKDADTLDFADFWRAYEALIVKVRSGKISPDDFAGTTCTITNPGMIGTVHSVPRLMPGPGLHRRRRQHRLPRRVRGRRPRRRSRSSAVSKVTTLTNTYDHRIITGRRER